MSVLLIDANNVAIRAAFAPNYEMMVGDINTGPLVLFVNTISRYTRIYNPSRGLVCWDAGSSAYRTMMFPAYKANRKQKTTDQAQMPIALIQSFLKLSGFPQLQLPGYEGDDLIAASWRACRGRERIYILSSDKDMAQMIEEGTEQIRLIPNNAQPDVWDRTRFIKSKGYKPEYQAYVLALTGDVSDGIPGLEHVGSKTAVKMLTQYDWDLGKLIEELPREQQDRVLLNLSLVDLSFVPLELPPPPELNLIGPGSRGWDELEAFCDHWELNKIKEKLQRNKLWTN